MGLRIVELTERAAGSYCGKVFADLGAEVAVIEPPSGKEGRRPSEDDPVGEARFVYLNTNKSSHGLDDSRGS